MAKMDAASAYRAGLFLKGLELLKQGVDRPSVAALRCELQLLVGLSDRAISGAKLLVADPSLSPSERSRCFAVFANAAYDQGNLPTALEWWTRALAAAEESRDATLTTVCSGQLLERVCDQSGFDSSLPLATRTRRAAARAADPQVSAYAHLTFGRLEGRAGHHDVALRHFRIARILLQSSPNEYLSAGIDIDESAVLMLVGDPAGAMQLARRGARSAEVSGWAKGRCAAYANLACIAVAADDLAEAKDYLASAEAVPFQNLGYRVALTDTAAQIAMTEGRLAEAEDMLRSLDGLVESASAHYKLYLRYTHVRLLIRLGHCDQAIRLAKQSLDLARRSKARLFVDLFEAVEFEARLGGELPVSSDALPFLQPTELRSLSLLGCQWLAHGKALRSVGQNGRALIHLGRATRILGSALNKPAELEAKVTYKVTYTVVEREGEGSLPSPPERPAATHLDSAVALLELSGHPHILGREAFVLIREAGCAEALALLAAGRDGIRVVDVHGWSAEGALAAARETPDGEFMTVGRHRDETWRLLARPRDNLDDRCTLAAIRKLLATALTLDAYRRDEKQRTALWPAEALEGDPESLWASEQAAELLAIARRIAATPLPVLITGETGTGKEMLARAIHKASDRAARTLVAFNCSAVPREMIESQLFGYRRGAFTGAEASSTGVIRATAGGTLFLDEIADIPLDVQPKLLRFLEHQEVQPLGDPVPAKVDVRIIAATNANLDELVAQGRFREDMLYRLNVIHLRVPPLRERREEIPTLVQHYIRRFSLEQKKGDLTLSDETLEYLLLYSWPGNIRQLANEVRRMVAFAEPGATLTPALLSTEIRSSRRTIPASEADGPEIRFALDTTTLPAAVELLEQTLVRRALERTNGRVEEAARLLGISRKGLFLKRRRWGFKLAS